MQNLREQLLKAGLISEADKKKVETEKTREPSRPAPSSPSSGPRGASAGARPQGGGRPSSGAARPHGGGGRPQREAPIPKLPPLADPNNKEFQRHEAKKQLELNRQIRELVLATQVAVEPGDHTFYFVTRKNRLRRIEMTPAQAQLLENGKLAVVERPDPAQIEHSLVPPETAEKLLALNEKTVRFFNKSGAPVGFLSDDEITRRQKSEAERATQPDAAEGAAGADVAATAPEDVAADEGASHAPAQEKTASESIAETAEKSAPVSSEEPHG